MKGTSTNLHALALYNRPDDGAHPAQLAIHSLL
jgi:hypothetical protein